MGLLRGRKGKGEGTGSTGGRGEKVSFKNGTGSAIRPRCGAFSVLELNLIRGRSAPTYSPFSTIIMSNGSTCKASASKSDREH